MKANMYKHLMFKTVQSYKITNKIINTQILRNNTDNSATITHVEIHTFNCKYTIFSF